MCVSTDKCFFQHKYVNHVNRVFPCQCLLGCETMKLSVQFLSEPDFDCSSYVSSKEFLCDENLERYLMKQGILDSHRCVQHTHYICRPAHLAPVSLILYSNRSWDQHAAAAAVGSSPHGLPGQQKPLPAWMKLLSCTLKPSFCRGWCFPSVKLLIFLFLKPLLPIKAYQRISKISVLGEGDRLSPK